MLGNDLRPARERQQGFSILKKTCNNDIERHDTNVAADGPTQGPKHKNIVRILCIVKNIQNAKTVDIKAKSDMVTRGKQAKSELQNRVWGGDPVLGGFDSYTLPP